MSVIDSLRRELGNVLLGKPAVIDHLVIAVLSASHVLIEDVPGVGKTTLAKALAKTFRGDFKRLQFTPDLLPTDVLGASIYDPRDGSFTFKPGPVFCNVLLADEINRASPRTQSALLEAMSEGQASVEGATHPLPAPFLVVATQNPVEFHGTYPLPEAQLDRFGLRIEIGYPSAEHEVEVLYAQAERHPLDSVSAVIDSSVVLDLQRVVQTVLVDPKLGRYMVDLVTATRGHASIRMGCSPRATLALFRVARARAHLEGRAFVIPEDIKSMAVPVLAHRLTLDTKARYAGVRKEDVMHEILERVAVPV